MARDVEDGRRERLITDLIRERSADATGGPQDDQAVVDLALLQGPPISDQTVEIERPAALRGPSPQIGSPTLPVVDLRGQAFLLTLQPVAGHLIVVSRDRTLHIGREENRQLQSYRLDYSKVSRRHAELSYSSTEGWVLVDRSSNGTWVNDLRVRQMPLESGDEIAVPLSEGRYFRAVFISRVRRKKPRLFDPVELRDALVHAFDSMEMFRIVVGDAGLNLGRFGGETALGRWDNVLRTLLRSEDVEGLRSLLEAAVQQGCKADALFRAHARLCGLYDDADARTQLLSLFQMWNRSPRRGA